MKHDIIRNLATIHTVTDVIESFIDVSTLPYKTRGRYSDAFVLVLSGFCTYTFDDGERITARKGDILYLAKNSIYKMEIGEIPYKYIFFDFLFEDTINEEKSSKMLQRESKVITPQSCDAANTLFQRLLHQWNTVSPDRILCVMSTVYEIYAQVVRAVHAGYLGNNVRGRIENAWKKIHICAGDPTIRVSELAAEAEMSEVYFRRLFTARYGITPSKCIIITRIAYAKRLMREEFFSLEDISVRSGFSSLSYFCKVFRAQEGISPAVYRKSIVE